MNRFSTSGWTTELASEQEAARLPTTATARSPLKWLFKCDGQTTKPQAQEAEAHLPTTLPASRPLVGNRYVLLEELGRGGMAIVYLAWDIVLRLVVAIKTLLPGEHLASQRIEDAWIIDDFDPDKHSDEVPRRSEGSVSHDAGDLHVGDLTPTACVVPSDILEGMFAWASSLMPLDSIVGRADPGSALGDGSLPIIYPTSLGHELDQNSINEPPAKIHTHSP